MKYFKISLVAILSIFLLSVTSCKKNSGEEEEEVDNTISVVNVNSRLLEHSWKVASFIDGPAGEQSAQFAGYRITFTNDYRITATKAGTVISGLWGIAEETNQLYLTFSFSTDPFNDLKKPWAVSGLTATRMSAQGDDGDELLVLEKLE